METVLTETIRVDEANKVIHIDLTKPQVFMVIGHTAQGRKDYILKVTGRGLMLV